MSTAKITLIGLYNYDDTIFDTMSLPEVEIETDENGNHIAVTVEKNVVINNMLLRYGEFEVLYPNPDFFKVAVKAVSDSLQPTFSITHYTTLTDMRNRPTIQSQSLN